MDIFGGIRDAIFSQAAQAQAAAGAAVAGAGQAGAALQTVDVEGTLAGIAQGKGNPALNWRSSIVDLMKLLDMDSSLDNRKALATELSYTGALDGSAEMNTWLQRRVMEELERNGGQVPASMKD